MLSAFRRLIEVSETEEETWEGLEYIMSLRADFLINRVLVGLNLSMDEAKYKLNKADEYLSEKEKEERDILIAAYDNLVDFAVAEEFQMMSNLPLSGEDDDVIDIEEFEDVFEKYNSTYAYAENQEVSFAASMAFWWLAIASNTIVTYVTQRDERVRDSHAILDGESYPKSQFPQELIPPIEWGCRCYLVESDGGIQAYMAGRKHYLPLIDPIFAESLAKGGRIFTDKHPYFKIPQKHKQKLSGIADRIKSKYYGY